MNDALRFLALALIALLLPVAAATAQDQTADPRLEPQAVVIESLGLTIHPPRDCEVSIERLGNALTLILGDRQDNPRWRLRLQSLRTTKLDTTAESQVIEYVDSLREFREAPEGGVSVIDIQPFRARPPASTLLNDGQMGPEGRVAWIKVETAQGQPYIDGKLVLPTGPQSYLVASVITVANRFDETRDLLEASFRTITLASEDEQAIRQKLAIGNGTSFLAMMTETRLREFCGIDEWTRIYVPGDRSAGTQDLDLGFARFTVSEGARGRVQYNKDPRDYNEIDAELGLLVEVRTRIIQGTAQNPTFVDTAGIYWMSWDQTEEEWDARRTRKQGDASLTKGWSGNLLPPQGANPHARLIVVEINETAGETAEWNVPRGQYMPQALGWLVPRILATEGLGNSTNAYYTFRSFEGRPQLVMRKDSRMETVATPGHAQVQTSFRENESISVAFYNQNATWLRTRLPNGHLNEPTPREVINRIWTAKGFPSGDLGSGRR